MPLLFPLSLLFTLGACDSDTEPAEAPVQQVQTPEPTEEVIEEVPAEEPLSETEQAVALAEAGRHTEAVAALKALLESQADDPGWWRLLGQEALLSNESGALLDHLDADTAIGGQNASHQRLRASLALATDRPSDALDAAGKLRTTDDEEGAAFWVQAWRAMEPNQRPEVDPEALDPTKVGDALVLAATIRKYKSKSRRIALLQDVAPTHSRAQLLRAELLEEVGVRGEVDKVMVGLLTDSDPEVRHAAALATAQNASDASEAAGHYTIAAKAAAEAHNGLATAQALELAVDSHLKALESDVALSLAMEMHAARSAANDSAGAALTAMAVARAARAAGEVQTTLSHAREAAMAFTEAENTQAASAAAWLQIEAAWHLGLPEELQDAAKHVEGQADVVNALGQVLVGDAASALDSLAGARVGGTSGVQILLAAARAASYTGGDAVGHATRAVKAADATGNLPARIESRLALETYAVAAGNSQSASTARAELARIAKGLDNGVALASEVAARTVRSGGSAAFPSEGAPASNDAWAALANGTTVPSATADEHPTFAWARARNALKASEHEVAYEHYRSAIASTPRYLAGPWTPISVLDGRAGPLTDMDLAMLHGRKDISSGLIALALQDDWRARGDSHVAFAIGDDPSLALETDLRMALNEAHRRLAVQDIRWLCGVTDAPQAARHTLGELEKKAQENKAFKRSLPMPPADYRAIQENLRHLAILSYRLGAKTGDATVVTGNQALVVKLTDTPAIREAATSLRANIITGTAMGGEPTSPLPGDALRAMLVDIFQQELTGIGRYLVLPDGPLWGFSFNVLPEQKKGLRFLADIRSIGNSSTVAQAFKEPGQFPLTFNPDFLGLAPFPPDATSLTTGLPLPSEVANAGRIFGSGLREIHERKEATASSFRDKAATTRFLHMSDVRTGERAGLQFVDETVPLHEIRDMDMVAQAVILSATCSPEVMRRRAQAIITAGARSVLLASWLVRETVRGRYLYTYYEAGNRDRVPSRAMAEAREALQKDRDDPNFDPSFWGQFILHGSP